MIKHRPITPKSVKPISVGHGIRASTMKVPKDNVGISFNEHVGVLPDGHVGISINKPVGRSSGESIGVPMYIGPNRTLKKSFLN